MNEPTTEREAFKRPADHEERMKAAERLARWYLGDAGWGGMILGAYLYPDESNARLDGEESR